MKNIFTLATRVYPAPVIRKIIAGYCLIAGLVLLLPSSLLAAVSFGTAPQDQTICAGSPATFSVGATGSAALTYQWQVSTNGGSTWTNVSNGATYTGSTTMTLRIYSATIAFNSFKYRCSVSDGSVANSTAATLTVNAGTGPVPSLQDNALSVQCANTLGSSPNNSQSSFIYQWQMSTDGLTWANLDPANPAYTGTTDPVLNWDGTQAVSGDLLYRYTMKNGGNGCSAISAIDTLRIAPMPVFLSPTPGSTSICSGGSTGFTFTSPPSGYAFQWQASSDGGTTFTDLSNNSTYSGTATPSLTVNGLTTAVQYRAWVNLTTYNVTCGTVSGTANLTMKTLPAITGQPANQVVCAGTSPKFTVTATGSNLTYQWQTDNGTNESVWSTVSNGSQYSGATTKTVTVTSVTVPLDGYKYKAIVGGPCGGAQTSSIVTLHIGNSGTWLGTQDTAWEHAGNWCSIVPLQTTDVLVPSWAPRMPLISDGTGTALSQKLTIQSGASLTISGGATSMTGPFSILGAVSYTGTVNQPILPADHGSLYISGSGNKTMQSNIAITNSLGLGGSAKLVTSNNVLTMKAGSNPIIVGSATSWIVTGNGGSGAANTGIGGLRLVQVPAAASNQLFPIGPTPTIYNPLFLTNGGAANDFTIAVNDQLIPGGPVGAMVNRTWLVSAAGAGSNITLRLQWNQPEEPSAFDRTSAAVMRSDGVHIVQKSAPATASGANPYAVSGGSFSSITQFSVGNNTMVPLPVQLLSFAAQWTNDATASLSWTTDPQSETSTYTVQRSTDGIRFTDIGTVAAGKGTTTYSYPDVHPSINNSYRLKLTSPGGDISYSRIIQLSGNAAADQAALAPSVTERPTTSLLLSLNKASEILYTLSDISGRTVSRTTLRLAGGSHNLPLDISGLRSGIYFIRVTGSNGLNKTLTLVKR